MVKKDNSGWRPVQLPKYLVDEVEKIIKTHDVKKQGITSISQFISRLVNNEFEKLDELKEQRLIYMNTYDDHLKILDNKIGKLGLILSVYFKKDNSMWCDYCNETNCVHVQYAKEIPHMKSNVREPVIEKQTHTNFRSVIVKDTYIELIDEDVRNGIPIKITFDKKKLHCEECESFNCDHVKHVWSIEHISNQLEEMGLTIVEKTCPKCNVSANKTEVGDLFGHRKSNGKVITQSWCRYCRAEERKNKKQNPRIDNYL